MPVELPSIPTSDEPLSLAEIKAHLRVDYAGDDDLIMSYLIAARSYVEMHTRRVLMTQTIRYAVDEVSGPIELPVAPVQSIASVIDSDGNTLDAAAYTLVPGEPAKVLPTASWPTASVEINFVAGYGTSADVPAMAKHAIRLMVSHFYELREPVITGTIATPIQRSVDAMLAGMSWGKW